MAGAGYKLFNTGDVLTAAQVNTYLQEQAVMRFANAAARTTALSGVLAEGMVSYLMDTDSVEVYNGTSWVGVATGDITGVTAGTGLSGGGTSGDVTLSLSTPVSATNGGTAQTTYATGDLLYASASNTLAKRAIGTTGQVLTVSGGVPTWATPASGGGKVLQVVSTTYSTAVNIASSTYTDTGLSLSITPSATSSKVLVLATQALYHSGQGSGNGNGIGWQLVRGSTAIFVPAKDAYQTAYVSTYGVDLAALMNCAYLDSPSTTSSVTYKTQARRYVGTGTVYCQDGTSTSTITLLEIGA